MAHAEDDEPAPQATPPVAYEDTDTIAPAEPDEPPAEPKYSPQPPQAVTTWPPESSVPPPATESPATESPPPFSAPKRPSGRPGWINENTTLPPDDDSLDLADEAKPPAAPPVDPLLNAARILSAAPPPRPSFPSRPMSLEDAPTVPPVEPRARRPSPSRRPLRLRSNRSPALARSVGRSHPPPPLWRLRTTTTKAATISPMLRPAAETMS